MHTNFIPYLDIDKDLFPKTFERLKKTQAKELSSTVSTKSKNKQKKSPKVITSTSADIIPIKTMVARLKSSSHSKTAYKLEGFISHQRVDSTLMNNTYIKNKRTLAKPKKKGRQPTIIKNGYASVARDIEDFHKFYDYEFEQSLTIGTRWFDRPQLLKYSDGIDDIVVGVYSSFEKQSDSKNNALSFSTFMQVLKLKVISRESVAVLLNTYPTNSTVGRYLQAGKVAYPFIKRWSKRFSEQENLIKVA